jgi:hypothetical protein
MASEAEGRDDRGGTLSFAYPLDRHQADGFQRPMVKAAAVSCHHPIMTPDTVEYKENVALLADW